MVWVDQYISLFPKSLSFTEKKKRIGGQTKKHPWGGGGYNKCTFYIWSNAFRGIKRPKITIWICQGTTAPTCPRRGLRVHFDTDSFRKERTDFILTSHNTPSIVVTVKHMPNNRPHYFFMPALSHPDLDIQATGPPHPSPLPLTTESAYDLPAGQAHSPQTVTECHLHRSLSVWRTGRRVGGETPPLCGGVLDRAECPLSQIKGSSSGTVAEPTASGATHYYMRGGTCDLFNYSALHFYPTIQNATWELIASKIHLYNLPQGP